MLHWDCLLRASARTAIPIELNVNATYATKVISNLPAHIRIEDDDADKVI